MALPRHSLHKYKISGIPLESYSVETEKTRWPMSPTYVVILHILAAVTVVNLVAERLPLFKSWIDMWWAGIMKG